MKYGESIFDILYLLFAITSGVWILCAKRDRPGRLMGAAALILGVGDAFHLVPRVLNYFIDADFTAALGAGKLVTSITMTVFYAFMYAIWRLIFRQAHGRRLLPVLAVLMAARMILCLMPQNRWLTNEGSVTWGIIRNAPFVIIGAILAGLYYRKRMEVRAFRNVWLYIALSFLFYIPVAAGASIAPMLGMLMLPKTICYILILAAMLRYAKANRTAA